MTPYKAYYTIKNNTKLDFDLEYYQKIVCENPKWAHRFAKNIPGADIVKCQEAACVRPDLAYYFALDVPGADIEYCQKIACKELWCAYLFAKNIAGANIEHCRKGCEGSKVLLNRFDQMIIEKAML